MIKTLRNDRQKGLSMIEMVMYVALLGVLAVFMTNYVLQVIRVYQQARAEREILANMRVVVETLEQAIGGAEESYAPTSRFNVTLGQLSLITPIDPPASHTTGYTDVWVDNGRLWMRKEGQTALPITAKTVQVKKFFLEQVAQAIGKQAVIATIQIDANQFFGHQQASVTLQITVATRNNY